MPSERMLSPEKVLSSLQNGERIPIVTLGNSRRFVLRLFAGVGGQML